MTKKELLKVIEDMPMDKEISLLITDIDGYTIPYTNLRICLVSGEWIKLIET
jgi:hypothetical protein